MKFITSSNHQSIQIGKLLGIPILVHWSFSLFLAFIVFTAWRNEFPIADSFWFIAFVFILFTFVIMHELGHAIAARKYGTKTLDIIISPIGGIARLQDMPSKPNQELVVALAGPMVNLLLAFIFMCVLLPFSTELLPESQRINLISAPLDYLRYLLLINISLVIFNLIPAFPMDGGRVFRALLSMKYNRIKATYIATTFAKGFAILFLIIGIYLSHVILIVIGGFVLFTSGVEYSNAVLDKIFEESRASEVVLKNPITLRSDQSFATVANLKSNNQGSYLIKDDRDQLLGVIVSPQIKYAKKERILDQTLSEHITLNFGTVHEEINLNTLFSLMNKHGWYVVNVISRNLENVGIIDRRILENFIQARKKN